MDDIEEGAVAFKLGLDTMGWNLFQRSIRIIFYILVFTKNLLRQEFKKTGETSTEAPLPPVDLHWFFEISIRTEKKISVSL